MNYFKINHIILRYNNELNPNRMSKKIMSLVSLLLATCLMQQSFAQRFSIGNEKNNTVSQGVTNKISIMVEGFACDELIVKTNNGKIEGNDCIFSWTPEKSGDCMVEVFRKVNDGEERIARKEFVSVPVRPVFKIARGGTNIPLVEVKSQNYARVESPVEGENLVLKKFDVNVISSNGESVKKFSNTGNKLSDEFVAALQKLAPGDLLVFNNIEIEKYEGPKADPVLVLAY